MTEPTEDEILQRAKELAEMDGKVWDDGERRRKEEVDGGAPVVADDSEQAEYLNRAKRQLLREART
jgi:hypothetical protein